MVETKKEAAPVLKKAGKPKLGFAARMLLIVIIFAGVVYQAAAVVMIVGMLPSIVAFLTDATRDKTRAFTIALLNFVTCFYFVLIVTADSPRMDVAIQIVSTPLYIVVMYMGAATGYFLDWATTGISNIFMTGKARSRQQAIKKRQEELVKRFGPEVTGKVPLDQDGYPLVVDVLGAQ
jgi:hypothetical protein